MKDKIVIWLGSELTHFCIAYYLQQNYDCDLYAIVDITDKPKKFFQTQKLVNFKKIWYFHDHIDVNHTKPDVDYLENIENKYNVNIWKLAINERIFYRFYNFHKFKRDEILSIDEQACKLFEQVLEIKPDFFLTKLTAFHHLELFRQMCKSQGVKVLMLSLANIGKKCILSQEAGKLDQLSKIHEISERNLDFEDLQNYLKTKDYSGQIRKMDSRHGNSKIDLLKGILQYFFTSNNNIKTHYNYFGRTKFSVISFMINTSLKTRYRQSFIDKNLETKIDHSTPFVYFPLGVDLERNLLINAPFYSNQIEIIRHIVKSLPVGYKLFVKENPSQKTREWRSINEYKEIMNIPNVTLLHPSVPTDELYKNCSLVITIGGTSGLEATAFGKPSVVFTNLGYSILPSVFRIKEIEELPNLIKLSLKTKVDPKDLDRYFVLFEKYSFDFDWFDFVAKINEYFYYSGVLVDVNISETKMKEFLDTHKSEIEKVSLVHINRIKELKIQTK